MNEGLLWYDNGATDLAHKLARAIKRYMERFGERPNVCYVNPAQLAENDALSVGIQIRPSTQVARHHYWLGQETVTGA